MVVSSAVGNETDVGSTGGAGNVAGRIYLFPLGVFLFAASRLRVGSLPAAS
jgi:hypothetical protein